MVLIAGDEVVADEVAVDPAVHEQSGKVRDPDRPRNIRADAIVLNDVPLDKVWLRRSSEHERRAAVHFDAASAVARQKVAVTRRCAADHVVVAPDVDGRPLISPVERSRRVGADLVASHRNASNAVDVDAVLPVSADDVAVDPHGVAPGVDAAVPIGEQAVQCAVGTDEVALDDVSGGLIVYVDSPCIGGDHVRQDRIAVAETLNPVVAVPERPAPGGVEADDIVLDERVDRELTDTESAVRIARDDVPDNARAGAKHVDPFRPRIRRGSQSVSCADQVVLHGHVGCVDQRDTLLRVVGGHVSVLRVVTPDGRVRGIDVEADLVREELASFHRHVRRASAEREPDVQPVLEGDILDAGIGAERKPGPAGHEGSVKNDLSRRDRPVDRDRSRDRGEGGRRRDDGQPARERDRGGDPLFVHVLDDRPEREGIDDVVCQVGIGGVTGVGHNIRGERPREGWRIRSRCSHGVDDVERQVCLRTDPSLRIAYDDRSTSVAKYAESIRRNLLLALKGGDGKGCCEEKKRSIEPTIERHEAS